MSKRQGWLYAVVVVVAAALYLGMGWIVLNRVPTESPEQVGVQAAAQPVVLNIVPVRWITSTSGVGTSYGAAYYREATGFFSTTVAEGYVTYTVQSSPDATVWFTNTRLSGISASARVTIPLQYFGPYIRIGWDAMSETSVTGTVWLSFKE